LKNKNIVSNSGRMHRLSSLISQLTQQYQLSKHQMYFGLQLIISTCPIWISMLKLMLRIVYTHTGLFFTSSGRGPFCSIYGHSII